jgi:hypothetical protein
MTLEDIEAVDPNGEITDIDHIADNKLSARWALAALEAYGRGGTPLKELHPDDLMARVVDTIASLLHLANLLGYDPDNIVTGAVNHFDDERQMAEEEEMADAD